MAFYLLLVALLCTHESHSFVVRPQLPSTSHSLTFVQAKTAKKRAEGNKRSNRKPSKVVDVDGPTPDLEMDEVEEIDPDSLDELREITKAEDLPTAVPHQPWRRGDTAGCDAPIAAEWRQEAETIIQRAVTAVGGNVLDITWFLTQVVVTLDEEMQRDIFKTRGPVIDIVNKQNPGFQDPDDPEPEEIWQDEDDVVYTYQTEEEKQAADQRRNMMYATKDADDPEEETHIPDMEADEEVPLYVNQETRADAALSYAEEAMQKDEEGEKPMDVEAALRIDSSALSTIARAILDALEEREEELNILSRHELILTSPGASDILETQRQFDAYRGFDVMVETVDPFKSNRTLKGKLVNRNSMDLIINQKGRMVTIPLNFVKCVRLPPAKKEKGVPKTTPF